LGKEVTPTTLRQALGGGSLTTIYKHLEAWQATRPQTAQSIIIAMPDTVQKMFTQAWQAAVTEAGKEIITIREKADFEIQAITKRLEEAIDNITQLEAEGEADTTKIEELESQLHASLGETVSAKTESATLLATNNQIREQLAGLQSELKELRHENKQLIQLIAQHPKLSGQLETLKID